MKFPLYISALGLLNLLSACQLQQAPATTTVDGELVHKYTRQPIAGVPVELKTWRYGAFGSLTVDSVTSVRTDANGKFHLAFDATTKGVVYRVRFHDYRNLFDLTDYRPFDSRSFSDGASLAPGQANHIHFEATSFVPIQMLVDVNKGGKSTLNIGFLTNQSTDNGDGFWGNVLTDTVRNTQRVQATQVVRVVPNRSYRFLITRSNIVRSANGNTNYINEVSEGFDRFIGYNDTTIIRLH